MCESGEQHLLVRQLAIRQAARPEDVCQAQLKTRRVFKRFGLRSWPRFFCSEPAWFGTQVQVIWSQTAIFIAPCYPNLQNVCSRIQIPNQASFLWINCFTFFSWNQCYLWHGPYSFLLPGGVGQLLVRRSLERRGMPSSTVLEGRVGPLLSEMTSWLGGGLTYFFNFRPYSGKWSSLTNICQMSWNHQLDDVSWAFFLLGATFEEIWLKPPRMYTKPCRTNSANQIRWYIL